jgi:hypothetical protein
MQYRRCEADAQMSRHRTAGRPIQRSRRIGNCSRHISDHNCGIIFSVVAAFLRCRLDISFMLHRTRIDVSHLDSLGGDDEN